MRAGLATLDVLERENGWKRLEELGARLEHHLQPVLAAAPIPAQLLRIGSIFWLHLSGQEPLRSAEAIPAIAAERYREVFHDLQKNGVALAPSAYEVGFLSLAHTEADLERMATVLGDALSRGEGVP